MTERPQVLAAANQRLRAVGSATAPAAGFAWAVVKNWSARTWAQTKTAARVTAKVTKSATISALVAAERTLLSHSGRERTQAFAVWALILAFGVTSVDFLLTGGPEFSQGARAAPYVAHANVISPSSPRPATEMAYAAPVDLAALDEGAVEEATVTPTTARVEPAALIDAQPPKPEVEHTEATEGAIAHTKAKSDTERT